MRRIIPHRFLPRRGAGRRPGRGGAPRRPLLRGNQSGLTMIEILVSLIVLAVLVVPIVDALVVGRSFTAHRGEQRMALRLVERKIESLIAAGYGSSGSDANVSSVNLAPGSHPTAPDIVVNTRGDSDPNNDVFGDLTWNVTVDAYSTAGDSVYRKLVTVKLAWPQGAYRDSIVASTVIGA